jgi:hypothetical protein
MISLAWIIQYLFSWQAIIKSLSRARGENESIDSRELGQIKVWGRHFQSTSDIARCRRALPRTVHIDNRFVSEALDETLFSCGRRGAWRMVKGTHWFAQGPYTMGPQRGSDNADIFGVRLSVQVSFNSFSANYYYR